VRSGLIRLEDIRKTFTGTFERYGTRTNWNGFSEKTVLLVDIKDLSGKKVTGHIWFHLTKGFNGLGELKKGTVIQFDARVKSYIKGYKGYREEVQWEKPIEEDYKLNNPTKIKILNNICLEVIKCGYILQ